MCKNCGKPVHEYNGALVHAGSLREYCQDGRTKAERGVDSSDGA